MTVKQRGVVVVLLVFVSGSVQLCFGNEVQAAEQPVQTEPLSEADKIALRADLERVARALGVEPEAAPAVTAEKPETKVELKTEKTLVEVSDRALTMIERMVTTAASGLEKAAPQVWRVMVRQQYAKAIQGPVFALFLLMTALALRLVARKVLGPYDPHESDGAAVARAGTWILLGVAFIRFGAMLSNSAVYLINPEYYALRDLVQVLLGKTPGG